MISNIKHPRLCTKPPFQSINGEHGREWLRGLVDDLADDGLVDIDERSDGPVVRLGD